MACLGLSNLPEHIASHRCTTRILTALEVVYLERRDSASDQGRSNHDMYRPMMVCLQISSSIGCAFQDSHSQTGA